MHTFLKRTLLTLLMLAAALWLYVILQPKSSVPAASKGNLSVHIMGNGWHAGLLLPADAINARLPMLRQRFPKAVYYEIGWGDAGFYRAKEVTIGLAMQAMFTSKGAVMHVVAVPDIKRFMQGSDTASLCVDDAAYQRMATLIAESFERDPSNEPVDAGPGIYGDSQFYIAKGSYSALNTCNRWTASVLEAAGIDISPRISLTAGSVLDSTRASTQNCPVAP